MSRKFTYYSLDGILSRNAVYNAVCGGRGIGKSYAVKKYCVDRAIKRGEEFIYLRRYKTELKQRTTFFSDIEHLWPDYEFRVQGNSAVMRLRGDKKWQVIGYFCALSTSQQSKSVSYPRVHTIMFDEFIIGKGSLRYLNSECGVFNDFYSTVDRYQDRVRVFMLSNAVSIMNPYMIEWGIEPRTGFVTRADGFICFEFPDSSEFNSQVAETRFGGFLLKYDEEYADYAIANTFADNNDELILGKPPKAIYMMTLRTKGGTFSVWWDHPAWYIQEKRPKKESLCSYGCPDVLEGEMILTYNDTVMGMMRTAFRQSRMYYDTPRTRNAFAQIFLR